MLDIFPPSLLLLFLTKCPFVVAQTYPTTVELDVVFPRNETYAPADIFPIVFAFQNSLATIPLIPNIQWRIQKLGSLSDPLDWGSKDLAGGLNTSSDPYFVVFDTLNTKNATEGQYFLYWEVACGNCSARNIPTDPTEIGLTTFHNSTMFAIKKGAPVPNLAPDSSCATWQAAAFNVTGTRPVEIPMEYAYHNACAVIADPRPSADPCALKFNDEIASSIAASITAGRCQALQPAITSGCPATPTSNPNVAAKALNRWTMYEGILVWGVATVFVHALF
ncbi:hypothetical protein GQ53DRAFT_733090 [Thozetella sp. PMI_491]|nr:hypothetical protein GQ53DRAFT_733090 [Thozetella sp. PMI_491]